MTTVHQGLPSPHARGRRPSRGGMPIALLGWVSALALGGVVLAQHGIARPPGEVWLGLDEVASVAFIAALVGIVSTLAVVRWNAGRRRAAREVQRQLQTSEAAAREARDQVLRELHDGLGGRLASALSLTEQAAASEAPPDALARLHRALDESLAELRLSVDLLAEREHVVVQALGELRAHVEPALQAAGRSLTWDLRAEAEGVRLPAAETVHLLRLVREALCASLMPARAASRVCVQLDRIDTETGTRLLLVVTDDGLELEALQAPDAAQLARRLADMQRRATALGGQATIGAQEPGWGAEVVLPLAR